MLTLHCFFRYKRKNKNVEFVCFLGGISNCNFCPFGQLSITRELTHHRTHYGSLCFCFCVFNFQIFFIHSVVIVLRGAFAERARPRSQAQSLRGARGPPGEKIHPGGTLGPGRPDQRHHLREEPLPLHALAPRNRIVQMQPAGEASAVLPGAVPLQGIDRRPQRLLQQVVDGTQSNRHRL